MSSVIFNSLIIGSFVLFIPMIFCFIFSFFKVFKSKLASIFVYSFMSGMMIVMATLGLMREAYEGMHSFSNDLITAAVLVSGTAIGLFATLGIRFLISKFSKEMHKEHHHHNHSDLLFNISEVETRQSFWMVLWSLMGHKIIAGLSLGMLLYNSSGEILHINNIGLIIITLVHMIPESLLIFHKYYEISNSKWKSFLISFAAQLVVFIFLLIGATVFYQISSTVYWMMPLLFAISGGSILFVSIIDLVPEFIHNKNESNKNWYWILLVFCLGVIISVFLSAIHTHSH